MKLYTLILKLYFCILQWFFIDWLKVVSIQYDRRRFTLLQTQETFRKPVAVHNNHLRQSLEHHHLVNAGNKLDPDTDPTTVYHCACVTKTVDVITKRYRIAAKTTMNIHHLYTKEVWRLATITTLLTFYYAQCYDHICVNYMYLVNSKQNYGTEQIIIVLFTRTHY